MKEVLSLTGRCPFKKPKRASGEFDEWGIAMKSSLLAIVLVVALAGVHPSFPLTPCALHHTCPARKTCCLPEKLHPSCTDAEGRTCFVGQGQAVEQMYAPSQPFSLLFDPANYLVAPKSPVSGSPINCDTGVSGAANSSHCVNYLSASKLTRTFTCSEPSISGSTVNNKCSAGIVLANVDCCNATDACNAPAAAASITTAAVTATCRSTPVGRNGKLKATVPLSAAMVMELFNSTGMHTTRVLASLAAPAQHIPPLDAGNFLQEAIDLQCQSEISQKYGPSPRQPFMIPSLRWRPLLTFVSQRICIVRDNDCKELHGNGCHISHLQLPIGTPDWHWDECGRRT